MLALANSSLPAAMMPKPAALVASLLRRPRFFSGGLKSAAPQASPGAHRSWGIVMDIDGVVLRGGDIIPGAPEAVHSLREAGVPFAFMTNGGGITEAHKAEHLTKLLGGEVIEESRLLLSHTPMRALAERYRGRRVLMIGGLETVEVAESYGFDVRGGFAVTCGQIAAGTPGIFPRKVFPDGVPPLSKGLRPVDVNAEGEPPIEAVLIFYEPNDWWLDLQVASDILAGGRPLGSGAPGSGPLRQAAKVYACNPDFLWQAKYAVPRYAQGAFTSCLRGLWRQLSGVDLEVTEFGKPHASQFDAARAIVQSHAPPGSEPLKRLYMVGDNPAADIRGANAAPGGLWRSILVCTGVYRGGEAGNDPQDPAWRVEPDLSSAVQRLLAAPEGEHLAE